MLRASLVVLGLILFTAAVAKIGLLWSDPFADLTTGFPIWLIVLAIVSELALGIAVFTHISVPLLWFGYTSFFAILLIVSFTRWNMGFQSCDCFGSIKLPVWVTPVFNLLAVFVLLWNSPQPRAIAASLVKVKQMIFHFWTDPARSGMLAGVCAVCLAIFVVPGRNLQITPFARQAIADQRVLISGLNYGETATVVARLHNPSKFPFKIVGNNRSCGCVALIGQQVTIESGAWYDVEISVRLNSEHKWHQRVVFFVEHPSQDRLQIDLVHYPKG